MNDKQLVDTLQKMSDTISYLAGSVVCPSYHGMRKYQDVMHSIKEMRTTISLLKESVDE